MIEVVSHAQVAKMSFDGGRKQYHSYGVLVSVFFMKRQNEAAHSGTVSY